VTRVQMDITEMLVLQLRMIVKGARVLKLLWKMEQQELEDATCQDQHQFAQSVLQEELVQNVKSVLMDIMVIQRVFMELQDPVFSVNAMEILI